MAHHAVPAGTRAGDFVSVRYTAAVGVDRDAVAVGENKGFRLKAEGC